MLFEVNSTAGATMCSYITILSNNAVQDTKNFTVYLTSNSSGVLIPSYAQSVPVQILGGTTQCKTPSMCMKLHAHMQTFG